MCLPLDVLYFRHWQNSEMETVDELLERREKIRRGVGLEIKVGTHRQVRNNSKKDSNLVSTSSTI